MGNQERLERALAAANKKDHPWERWRPLSAHLDRARSTTRELTESRPLTVTSQLRAENSKNFEKTLGRLPCPDSHAIGKLRSSGNLKELLKRRDENRSASAAARASQRPVSAVAWLERRAARYGTAVDKVTTASADDLRSLATKYEEKTRLEALGLSRKALPGPVKKQRKRPQTASAYSCSPMSTLDGYDLVSPAGLSPSPPRPSSALPSSPKKPSILRTSATFRSERQGDQAGAVTSPDPLAASATRSPPKGEEASGGLAAHAQTSAPEAAGNLPVAVSSRPSVRHISISIPSEGKGGDSVEKQPPQQAVASPTKSPKKPMLSLVIPELPLKQQAEQEAPLPESESEENVPGSPTPAIEPGRAISARGQGYSERVWNVGDMMDGKYKEPSRRAVKNNPRVRRNVTTWDGKPLRPLTAPYQGGPNPNIPSSQRYPRCKNTRRVPTEPLQGEVELAQETISWLDRNRVDPRLQYHFGMDMERVWRSREFHSASSLHRQTRSTTKKYYRLNVARMDSMNVKPTDPLDLSTEAALFRILHGADGLQPDSTKARKERLELRAMLRRVLPDLREMFDHYRKQNAPGGLPNPPSAGPADDTAITAKLKEANTDVKSLIEGKEQTVALTAIVVTDAEVDEVVDIGDFEEISAYEQAKREAKLEIAAKKRTQMVQELNAKAETLKKELLRDRPMEHELITFSQLWRCMHEGEFACTEVPLAAINRLILPPSLMLANQRAEIAAGRDFRAGYKAMLRWVTHMGSEQTSTSVKSMKNLMGSLAGVASAAKAASQKSQNSVPLCTTLVHATATKTRAGAASPERDRSPDRLSKLGIGTLMDDEPDLAPAEVPTMVGFFSHDDELDTGKPLNTLEARRTAVPSKLAGLGKNVLAALGAGLSPYGANDGRTPTQQSGTGEEVLEVSPRLPISSEPSARNTAVSFRELPGAEQKGSLSGHSSKKRFLGPKGPTLETLIEAEDPHSPYAVGFAHQRSRVLDFFHFVETMIRVSHALYYNPKWDNTVAWCLGTAMEQHMPVFRDAVQDTAAELARQERAAEAADKAYQEALAQQTAEGGELQLPPPPPFVVPANSAAWQEQMAAKEMQEFLAVRQSRLMKIFLHFGTDLSEVPVEARLPGGPVMCFNEFVKFLSETDVMDAKLDTRRVRDIYQDVTGAMEVVANVHKNNAQTEMIYDEFLEVLVRCAVVVKLCPKEGAGIVDHLRSFLDDAIFRFCATAVPGKF